MANGNALTRNTGWILLGIGALAVYFLRLILVPFFLALAFAFITMPLVNRLSRRMPRTLAAVIVFFVCFIGGLAALFWLGDLLYHELLLFSESIARFFQTHDVQRLLPSIQRELPGLTIDWKSLFGGISRAVVQGVKAASGALFFIFSLFIVPLYGFYLLKDGPQLSAGFKHLLPKQNREDILAFLHEVNQILRNFVQGQLLIAACNGTEAIIGLAALGMDYSILLGTFIGATSLIPFLGKPLGFAPALLSAWLARNNLWLVAGVAALWLAIELVENTLLTPNILGSKMNLHPLVVILSIFIWGSLLGMLGVLLAAPITAVLQVIYLRLTQKAPSAAP